MPDPAPLAFIGFDAAEPTLVERGVREGWLPTLARLLDEGRAVKLAPVPSGFYNTSWVATITGTDVGDHGALLDRRLDSGSYRVVDMRPETVGRPPFWRYVSDSGLRATVANIYSAPPVSNFNGTQVHGWGTIDPYWAKLDRTLFEPPEVEPLLADAVGGRPENLYHIGTPRTPAEYRRYRDRLVRSIDEHTRGLVTLIERTDWDFFFCSFDQSHQAGHLLWHLVDPDHRLHDPGADGDLPEMLPDIYRAVDRSIGLILDRLPESCRTFVLTPHGMGPNYVSDPSEPLLERGGWLVRRTGSPVERGVGASVWQAGRRVLPTRLRRALRGRLPQQTVETMQLAHIDWSHTRAFALPSDLTSYIRVNLEGREPEGSVRPGREYDELCDELVAAYSQLVHEHSGLPAAERVVRCDELFGRPIDGSFPDVCVIWANHEAVTHLASPHFGSVELPMDDPRTGTHTHGGLLIGAGPGIPAGRSEGLGEIGGTLLDVAPTALALLGVPQPPELSGQAVREFVDAAN
jgi:predicted AlkP superfamily phosphohydrolase/phosphomutase